MQFLANKNCDFLMGYAVKVWLQCPKHNKARLTGGCTGSYILVSILSVSKLNRVKGNSPKVQNQNGWIDLMRHSAIFKFGHIDTDSEVVMVLFVDMSLDLGGPRHMCKSRRPNKI